MAMNLSYNKLFVQVKKMLLNHKCTFLTTSHWSYLCEQPWVFLRQSVKVGLGGHVGVAESVLDSRRCADVLVQELLSCLLRDGFGGHGCFNLDWPERKRVDRQREMNGEIKR